MFNIFDLCHHIIYYETSHNRPLTNLRLQILLYFIQIEYLAAHSKPCFNNTIEAWNCGPVVRETYLQYRFFGSVGITLSAATSIKGDMAIVNNLLEAASHRSTNSLIDIACRQTPYIAAYQPDCKNTITLQSIIDFINSPPTTV